MKMGIIWTIIIGFVAGVIAKFIMPGPNEPSGFIMTTVLGIVGAVVANFLGQALGWYGPGQARDLLEPWSARSSSCSCGGRSRTGAPIEAEASPGTR
mgnify:CR=1 FL=1